jgi:hypothetical protein
MDNFFYKRRRIDFTDDRNPEYLNKKQAKPLRFSTKPRTVFEIDTDEAMKNGTDPLRQVDGFLIASYGSSNVDNMEGRSRYNAHQRENTETNVARNFDSDVIDVVNDNRNRTSIDTGMITTAQEGNGTRYENTEPVQLDDSGRKTIGRTMVTLVPESRSMEQDPGRTDSYQDFHKSTPVFGERNSSVYIDSDVTNFDVHDIPDRGRTFDPIAVESRSEQEVSHIPRGRTILRPNNHIESNLSTSNVEEIDIKRGRIDTELMKKLEIELSSRPVTESNKLSLDYDLAKTHEDISMSVRTYSELEQEITKLYHLNNAKRSSESLASGIFNDVYENPNPIKSIYKNIANKTPITSQYFQDSGETYDRNPILDDKEYIGIKTEQELTINDILLPKQELAEKPYTSVSTYNLTEAINDISFRELEPANYTSVDTYKDVDTFNSERNVNHRERQSVQNAYVTNETGTDVTDIGKDRGNIKTRDAPNISLDSFDSGKTHTIDRYNPSDFVKSLI